MFEQIRLRNFRSIRDSGPLDFARLNVLVGPNNAGKSSVLYALLLLQQTLADKDRRTALVTSLPGLDLGGYRDLIYAREADASMGMEFKFREEAIPRITFSPGAQDVEGGTHFDFGLEYNRKRNQIRVRQSSVVTSKGKLFLRVVRRGNTWDRAGVPDEMESYLGVELMHFVPTHRLRGKPPKEKQLAQNIIRRMYASLGNLAIVDEMLSNILYIGPVRERIPPTMATGTRTYSEVGPTGADVMRVLASQERVGVRGQGSGRTVEQRLRQWLCRRFRILKDVRLGWVDRERTLISLLADERRGLSGLNVAYMGFGISQLVPLIVQTGLLPRAGCLLVEQPEVHLHPKAQADLADLFLAHVTEDRQFIVETHSEHFVLRLRRLIAEGKADPASVRLFYVTKPGNQTRIRGLEIDENGMVPEWPRGFFEDGYKEAVKIAEARMRRRRR
jgi:hypothetical protein